MDIKFAMGLYHCHVCHCEIFDPLELQTHLYETRSRFDEALPSIIEEVNVILG